MRARLLSLALLPLLMLLSACAGSTASIPPTATPLNVSGNWQIQSTSPPSSNPTPLLQLLLLGSLSSSGTSVTGTFRLANLVLPFSNPCSFFPSLFQVITVSGTVDALGNLALTSAPFGLAGQPTSTLTAKLLVPSSTSTLLSGTIAIDGGACSFPSSPAIGLPIAPISGTFAGPVSASTGLGAPINSPGTVSLTLSQAASPNPDGQYALTGTLGFSTGACVTSAVPVSGTVSGLEIALDGLPVVPFALSALRVRAFTIPSATQLTLSFARFNQSPCNSSATASSIYTGTLTRQ